MVLFICPVLPLTYKCGADDCHYSKVVGFLSTGLAVKLHYVLLIVVIHQVSYKIRIDPEFEG